MSEVALESYQGAFKALQDARAAEPAWLTTRRQEAMARFEQAGLPTTRQEDWKYTSLKPVSATPITHPAAPGAVAASVPAEAIEQVDFKGLGALRVVFVDGLHRPELSSLADGLPAGVALGSLASALAAGDGRLEGLLGSIADGQRPFVALNEALFGDGLLLHVGRNAVLETPIHVIHVSGERSEAQGAGGAFVRNLLVLEAGAQATVFETFVGPSSGPALLDVVTEVSVGDGARLRQVRVNDEGVGAMAVHNTHGHVGRDATWSVQGLNLGGQLVRNELRARLLGAGGSCQFGSAYPLTGRQHVDHFTEVEHEAPHCESHQLFKSVLHDRSRGVFQGRVHVHRIAQKTNAFQSNPNLILSEGAQADTKPQLEIYADDVRCSHGATVGQLDEGPLFYLRSRGLDHDAARSILAHGFAFELVDQIVDDCPEPWREAVEARLDHLLSAKLARFGC